jgi:ectoine hydroxylase-related dioxygenase (phytanoyl-CoA dioxygenase family)
MASKTNGVPSGQLRSFTMLIGVMLSDMPGEDRGNFTVWPGSHLLNAAYLREVGPRSLLEHMPQVELPEPVQIVGQAGDIVLAHYLLSHGTAQNLSHDIRYMVFFRLTHIGHDQEQWRSLEELWLHWPGLHDLRGPRPDGHQ